MEAKIGNVVCINDNLAEQITKNRKDNKFILVAVTNFSVSLRSLISGNLYSIRLDSFFQNLKWSTGYNKIELEDDSAYNKIKNKTNTSTNIKTEDKINSVEEKKTYVFMPSKNLKINGSGMSSFKANDNNNPYDNDPFSSIYG